MCTKYESEQSYTLVRGLEFASVSMIFRLDFVKVTSVLFIVLHFTSLNLRRVAPYKLQSYIGISNLKNELFPSRLNYVCILVKVKVEVSEWHVYNYLSVSPQIFEHKIRPQHIRDLCDWSARILQECKHRYLRGRKLNYIICSLLNKV